MSIIQVLRIRSYPNIAIVHTRKLLRALFDSQNLALKFGLSIKFDILKGELVFVLSACKVNGLQFSAIVKKDGLECAVCSRNKLLRTWSVDVPGIGHIACSRTWASRCDHTCRILICGDPHIHLIRTTSNKGIDNMLSWCRFRVFLLKWSKVRVEELSCLRG